MRLKCSTPKAGLTLPMPVLALPSLTGEDWDDEFTMPHLTSLWRKHWGAVSKGLLAKEEAGELPLIRPADSGETGSGRWGACPSSHNCQVTDQIQIAHPLGRTQLFCESLLLLVTHILYWVEGEPAPPNLFMNQGYKRGALLLRQAGAPFSA